MRYDLDEHLEHEILALAKKNGVKKIILFGSRARGDNGSRSDVDIAVSGGDIMSFRLDIEEKVPTLLMFDVVDLDRNISVELREEIGRDGITIYDERRDSAMKKYDNFVKALNNLKNGVKNEPPYEPVIQAGIIGLFEICYELSWKLMKRMLEVHGRIPDKLASPRTIIKLSYQHGMVSDERGWLDMLYTRNDLTHTYSDEDSILAIEKIKGEYIDLFCALKLEIDSRWMIDDEPHTSDGTSTDDKRTAL